jgi:hypothetical protein
MNSGLNPASPIIVSAFRSALMHEGLDQVPNWLYLTGLLGQSQAVWQDFGTVRQEIGDDPGPGTGATESSFAALLANSVTQTMGQG